MKQIFLIISFVVLSTTILSLKSVANNAVCEIEGGAQYATIDAALAAVPANTPTTIRLLQSINRTTTLFISGSKKITLNMNGFDLNINVTTQINGAALEVKQSSSLTTTGSGTFNASGFIYGIYATEGAIVDITGDVSATGGYSTSYGSTTGVYAYGSAGNHVVVTVNGNVSGYVGVNTLSSSEISVNGNISGVSYAGSARFGGFLSVSGDANSTGLGNCIEVTSATAHIGGNVTSSGENSSAIYAGSSSTITVGGNVNGVLHGITAQGGNVKVTGNVVSVSSATNYTVSSSNSAQVEVGGSVIGNGDVGVLAETSSKVTVTGKIQSYYCGIRVSQSGEVFAKGDVVADGTVGVGVNAYSLGKATIDGTINAYKNMVFGESEGSPVIPSTKEGFLTYSDRVDNTSYVWIKDPSKQKSFIISNEDGLIDELIRAGLGEKNLYEILVILQSYLTDRIPDNFIANLASSSADKEVFTTPLSNFAGTNMCVGISANGTIFIVPISFRAYYDNKEFMFYSFAHNHAGRVKLLSVVDPDQSPAVLIQGETASDFIISAIMW